MEAREIRNNFTQVLDRLSQYKHDDPAVAETFEDFILNLMKPSSFQSELISEVIKDDLVIVAHSPVKDTTLLYKTTEHSTLHQVTTNSTIYQESELDITGSPLPCPFGNTMPTISEETLIKMHLKDDRPAVNPVPAYLARYLLSLYMASINDLHESTGNLPSFHPLWVICDGYDAEQTILMGVYILSGKVAQVSVSCSGPLSRLNFKLDQIKQEHLIGIVNNQIKTSIEARYDVSQSYCNIGDGFSSCNNLSIICNWSSCQQLLERPPTGSESMLKVSIVAGNVESCVHKIYKELQILEGLFPGLSKSSWTNPHKSTDLCVLEKLNNFLEALKESTVRRIEAHRAAQESIIINTEFGAFSLAARQEFDFTDLLWEILKGFSNLEELAECFDKIFKTLKAKTLRPMVFKKNTTALAKLITGEKDLSALEKMKPLQLLIEIGIEKFRRDFTNFFIGSELTTRDQLTFFLEQGINHEESLVRLNKLYITLEVITECASILKLNRETLSVYTRQVLILNNTSEKPIYNYTFAIQTSVIHNILSGMDPSSWKICMSSSQNNDQVATSYHITDTCPINWMPLIFNKEIADPSFAKGKGVFASLVSVEINDFLQLCFC